MENTTFQNNFTTQLINNTETTQSKEFACKNYDLIMNVVVKVLLVGLGCVGNSLSVAVMWKERKSSGTAFLLIMLAITDTLLLFVWLLFVTFPGMYPRFQFIHLIPILAKVLLGVRYEPLNNN